MCSGMVFTASGMLTKQMSVQHPFGNAADEFGNAIDGSGRPGLRISGDQWGTEGATTGIGPESGIVNGESPSISLPYIDKESTNVRIQMQSCIYLSPLCYRYSLCLRGTRSISNRVWVWSESVRVGSGLRVDTSRCD